MRMARVAVLLVVCGAAGAQVSYVAGPNGTVTVLVAHDGDTLRLGPQLFGLRYADGGTITAADLRLAGPPQRVDGGLSAVFTGPDIRVAWRIAPLADRPCWRVGLDVTAPRPVVRCDVLRIEAAPAPDLGGFGQPWFLGERWFVGVEYPASRQLAEDGVIVASHAPGRTEFASKTAIVGHRGAEANLADAFESYLKATGRPRRSFLQYNSWYDLRGREMTVENFAAIFKGFQDHLLTPYGLRFDAFVPDDGWQDRDSIWEVDRSILPEEFAPLARLLEAGGSRLGIWMPVNGTNLSTAWGREQGYEVSELSDSHYQLVGPRYNAKIREVLKRRIEDGNLNYFKHDFNNFRTRRQPPLGADVDFEENLDAQLALHDYERQLQPDIFLNVTSGMWRSPWWLQHADAIWMGCDDFGYENRWPQPSRRDWAMSYRDQWFWGEYVRQRVQYPLSRLMTHGVIHGKLNQLGGPDETLREWADYVTMYVARGVQLKELYVTPSLMTPDRWRVLGRALQWAEAHAETLDHTRYVGGEPRAGEVYGYVHWAPHEGILVLRNPDVAPGSLRLTLAERPRGYGERGAWRLNRVYPDRAALPDTLTDERPVDVPVIGQSVAVYQLQRAPVGPLATAAECPITGSASIEAGDRVRLRVHAEVSAGAVEPEVQVILRAPAPPKLVPPRLRDAPLAVRTLAGAENVVWRLPLPLGSSDLELWLDSPGALFASSNGRIAVWARAELAGPETPDEPGLPVAMRPLATRCLLPETAYAFASPTARITDDELSQIRAVKVRLEIFDSNDEEPYRDKQVLLNGRPVAQVPANPRHRFSAWHEVILDLTPEAAGAIGRTNTLAVTTAGGDCWKCRGFALAVQKADGAWVATPVDPRVFSTPGRDWLYFEGELWPSGASPAIEVTLPGGTP